MNHTSSYALPFVPQDIKWYEKDKLMTWYDQGKYKDFLQDLVILRIQTLLTSTLSISRIGVKKFVKQP